MTAPQTLIIDLADLPSLAVVATQPAGERFVLWHPGGADESAARRRSLVQRHAEAFSAVDVLLGERDASCTAQAPEWFAQSELLLRALAAAEQCRSSRIIWPHQVGPSFDVVGPVVERAATLAAIPGMADHGEPIPVELPMLDLTDEQVVELADDSGASLRAFWPCAGGGPEPCGDCIGCRRWMDAFEQAGTSWPWTVEASGLELRV